MPQEQTKSSEAAPHPGVIYKFGKFHFEPGATRMDRGKDTLLLPPKEMALLALLVKSHGQLVTHRMIWNTLWPDQDVSYESITRCVYSLRRQLGVEAGKMIKSIPRKGYVFTAETHTIMPVLKVNSVIEKSIQTTPSAYALYQLGLLHAGLASPDSQQRAVTLFQRAHDTDPHYSVPLGALAEVSVYQSIRGYLAPADAARQASGAIDRALDIDPTLVSALAPKAWFSGYFQGDMPAATRLFDHALELDPNHALTYFLRGWVERGAGQLQTSLHTYTRGAEIDPLHFNIIHGKGVCLFYLGRTEEALALEKTYTIDRPEVDKGHFFVSIYSSWLGDHKLAIREAKLGLKASPKDPNAMSILGYALARGGFPDKARKLIDQARGIKTPHPISLFLAASYLALDEKAIALSLLQEAHDINCPWLQCWEFDPRLDAIRDTNEFHALFG